MLIVIELLLQKNIEWNVPRNMYFSILFKILSKT